jgi:type II restriction enzyme
MKLTAQDLIHAIGKLPTRQRYNYIETATTTKIQIVEVVRPVGPIKIKRYDPHKGKGAADAKVQSISTNMLNRVANAVQEGQVINIDRILGASYNTRAALETLMAHTPEFYVCHPGRIEISSSSTEIKPGHKHLIWTPDDPHPAGIITEKNTEMVISEMPGVTAVYESLELPKDFTIPGMNIEMARRHTQIQIALVEIGRQLGYRTWVANNDKGITYKEKKLGEMEGVIGKLDGEALIAPYQGAVRAAHLIDCIWFRNSKFMPAVIEIEHTTGVTSGLTRMKKLQEILPPFQTRWVVAAPDEDRDKVLQEANNPMFRSLKTWFFPYSGIEELYALCQRRHLTQKSVNEEFIESFMEPCLPALN